MNANGNMLSVSRMKSREVNRMQLAIVGRICNNFEKNRAFYDKSMKLGTWLVDNKTKK